MEKVYLIDDFGNEHLLVEHLEIAATFSRRFFGLMGRKELKEKHGLLLYPCSSIHCFFMRFPIDVVYISKDWRIVKVVRNMKPWRVDFGHRDAYYTLELPSGSIDIERGRIEIRDM